jgi:hypothetical protein
VRGSLLSIMVRRLRLVVPVGGGQTSDPVSGADHQSTLSKEDPRARRGEMWRGCHGCSPPVRGKGCESLYDCPT